MGALNGEFRVLRIEVISLLFVVGYHTIIFVSIPQGQSPHDPYGKTPPVSHNEVLCCFALLKPEAPPRRRLPSSLYLLHLLWSVETATLPERE